MSLASTAFAGVTWHSCEPEHLSGCRCQLCSMKYRHTQVSHADICSMNTSSSSSKMGEIFQHRSIPFKRGHFATSPVPTSLFCCCALKEEYAQRVLTRFHCKWTYDAWKLMTQFGKKYAKRSVSNVGYANTYHPNQDPRDGVFLLEVSLAFLHRNYRVRKKNI